MFSPAKSSNYWLPRFRASIPVELYVNGKVVPPIEDNGEITSVSISGMQLKCNQKIPIPAKGVIRFVLDQKESVEMKVDFVRRVEVNKNGWLWKSTTGYEMDVNFGENPAENVDKFKRYFHQLLYNGQIPGSACFEMA